MAARERVVAALAYKCRCGRQVFFRNSQCLACCTPLGYVPSRGRLFPLRAGARAGTWRIARDADDDGLYRRCSNFGAGAACNWLIEPGDAMARCGLCRACRLNRTIPDLTESRNLPLWLAMERAKRRLVAQLIRLALPVASKVNEDPERGIAYDFLRSLPGRSHVMTGHCRGIITINIEEADDVVRERIRVDMGEPYRTLLGHFRHEIGHYYWFRLVDGSAWQSDCRALFGDERADYGAALRSNYSTGPPPDWRSRFVSAYASAHPSEDWAESWAHYLHVRDTLDTADSAGIDASADHLETEPFGLADLWQPAREHGPEFLRMLNRWVRITGVMNEMSRAMGLHDFYPFVLPRPAVAKLHLIHSLVQDRLGAQGDG